MSSIKLDLYRRDFTVNTLAIQLNPDRFGLLIDFFNAQKDIKEKSIRVLQNLSFVEDPTRFLERRHQFQLWSDSAPRSAVKREPGLIAS